MPDILADFKLASKEQIQEVSWPQIFLRQIRGHEVPLQSFGLGRSLFYQINILL